MYDFNEAIADYRYLRERSYPEQAALKVVGDRYRLTAKQRNLLFRGVLPEPVARARRAKIVAFDSVAGRAIGVDWYNVLIIVESYLKGVAVFLADDGVIRDAAGVHGSYRTGSATERATAAVLEALRDAAPGRVDLYVDAPVAFSGDMAEGLRVKLRGFPFACGVEVAESPDYFLKSYRGIVASADSVILDAAAGVLDLARHSLHRAFGFDPPGISAFAGSDP
jgi:hypothetical protein